MQEKTIRKVLVRKINDWLTTITDEQLVKDIKKDIVVSGGCFTSFLQNESPKDYDIYFKTKETVIKVAEYYAKKWNTKHTDRENGVECQLFVGVLDGANIKVLADTYTVTGLSIVDALVCCGAEITGKNTVVVKASNRVGILSNTPKDRVKMYIASDGVIAENKNFKNEAQLGDDPLVDNLIEDFTKTEKYRPVFMSTNAITLSDGIQLVVRFYGNPSEIHDTYDFQHTKSYFTFDEGLIIPKEVYQATINKVLIYTGSKYPVCSVCRMRKFMDRGWTISAGQILKMCMQISELDLTDIDVLEDQLVGVDSLYFTTLIRMFREAKEKGTLKTIDSTYVANLIDKIM